MSAVGLVSLPQVRSAEPPRTGHGIGTAAELAEVIERFLGLEAIAHLSRAALETLAIVAYQQPVTRPQIDSIRGVNSDAMMKSLLGKGLIQEAGRTVGIVGCGRIGSRVYAKLHSFGVRFLVCDPYLPEQRRRELGIDPQVAA